MIRTAPLLLCFLFLGSEAIAERPSAMRLFPEETVIFFRTPDATELAVRFKESLGGRMVDDPEVAPLANNLFQRLEDLFNENVSDNAGLAKLNKLRALIRGELAVGFVHRQNQPIAFALLLDTTGLSESDNPELADYSGEQLLESIRSLAERNSIPMAEEDIVGQTALVIRPDNDEASQIGILLRDGVLLASNDRDLLASMLIKWDGGQLSSEAKRFVGSLAENEAFTTAIRECVEERIGDDNTPPHMIVYADPIGILRAAAQDNMSLRIALAVMPTLGLDGIQGLAGAAWYEVGGWESLMRGHLLLENPRSGVLRILRLQSCDLTPSPLVPEDITNYVVFSVDLSDAFDKSGQLHDLIRGEGTFAENVEATVDKALGVDLREILATSTGRIEWVQGFGKTEEGAVPRASAESLIVFEVKDPEKAKQLLRKIVDKVGRRIEWIEDRGVEYVRNVRREFNPPEDWDEERTERIRRLRNGSPTPSIGVVGNHLVFSQSHQLFTHAIDTYLEETPRLADSLPFRIVSSRSQRLIRSSGPSEGVMLMYSNPTEQMRRWYASYDSAEGKQHLDDLAKVVPFFRGIRDALEETGMPSEEAMLKYASPSGGIVYDTATGFRFVSFVFDRDSE